MLSTPRSQRVGLVLGAGGIRGCAHAGVISVLREAAIPIDVVVGASVGAIFGLGLAAGLSSQTLARAVEEVTPLEMGRFYAGRLRCAGRNPIARMLLEAGEGKTFADLELPFGVVVTEMATGKPCVIDAGPVLPAIEASIAVPLIARPKAINRVYYVDGGLFDTVPVHVARSMGADKVIAVCLGANYTAPTLLQHRPWIKDLLERVGTQQGNVHGGVRDQLRFTCRLLAAGFDPPKPGVDADIALWPVLGTISPNSLLGAQACFEGGVACAIDALETIQDLVESESYTQSTVTA